uniref:2,3-bisphosphoglycerate-independent phosphoglycerate mutase n=1 Tax=Plocamium cartilagineum TaxID=31452 RepID=A0A1C9CHQ7_PLOCA|nr:phosphoglycerate mutase [Plocamium cartilagineum]AOM67924.1 phosphoglycerate mutase [Plocamium cartilagineum]
MQNTSICPVILTILDGWGYSENTKGNAIKLAETPTMDKLWKNYLNTLLNASGINVGLPLNQVGNSEVGHTTIAAGRIINQDLVRISKSIKDKTFFNNENLHNICKTIELQKTKLHIIGLCSDGGVHSHTDHLLALIDLTKKYNQIICLHLITDGRDTEASKAKVFIKKIIDHIKNINNISICTISGRYYSMDRDSRWSRIEQTYQVLIEDKIHQNINPLLLIDQYYKKNISDEFIPPTRIEKGNISDNDGIIFFNFRPDRSRQLLQSLATKEFKGFSTKKIKNLNFVTFTQYDSNLSIPIVFPKQKNENFLGEIISKSGLKQLRLAETEKYAHVTYFFNGGHEEPFAGEDRELVPSPQVDTYDLEPHMSAEKLTQNIINAINKNIYKLIVVNYANPDMVGHTGNMKATIEAINIVDKCIQKVFNAIQIAKGTLIITADHGNAEYMITEKNQICKSHSTNLVPFILISDEISHSNNYKLRSVGCLADIAPTVLDILNIEIPTIMKGQSLIIK